MSRWQWPETFRLHQQEHQHQHHCTTTHNWLWLLNIFGRINHLFVDRLYHAAHQNHPAIPDYYTYQTRCNRERHVMTHEPKLFHGCDDNSESFRSGVLVHHITGSTNTEIRAPLTSLCRATWSCTHSSALCFRDSFHRCCEKRREEMLIQKRYKSCLLI